MTKAQSVLSLDQIAEAAERLYEDQFRGEYEGSHDGEFLAIDVVNQGAYLGRHPEDALNKANSAVPDGTFYLVRIGKPTTFNVGNIGEQESEPGPPIRPFAHSVTGLQPT